MNFLYFLALLPVLGQEPEAQTLSPRRISLETIMADPDWIGRAPQNPHWSLDDQKIFFYRKRPGSPIQDLYWIPAGGGEAEAVADEAYPTATLRTTTSPPWSSPALLSGGGDLFLYTETGETLALTQTEAAESRPLWLEPGKRFGFFRSGRWMVRNFQTGLEYEPVRLKTEDRPEATPQGSKNDFLSRQQRRLFPLFEQNERQQKERNELSKARRRGPPESFPIPVYLGEGQSLEQQWPSPNGRWMVVKCRQEGEGGNPDHMPQYVTEDGYVANREVRPKVGTGKAACDFLYLVNLEQGEFERLDLELLPGRKEDPLAFLTKTVHSPLRNVLVLDLKWNPQGDMAIAQIDSWDHKDRWWLWIHPSSGTVRCLERDQDPAWLSWDFRDFDWLPDGHRFWFLSERSGYAHLYLRDVHQAFAQVLTSGAYEVSDPTPSLDGRSLFFRANRDHPGVHEFFQVNCEDGTLHQWTQLGGRNRFWLNHRQDRLLISHSTLLQPEELYSQELKPGAQPKRLTWTVEEEFQQFPWVKPEVVAIPGPGGPIYSRFYAPRETPAQLRPAVIFIHGAGYLQNAHLGWSGYFREFLFHSFLVQEGYVVLDMDYRASAGYGRDWRTAIYRHMGGPELEDLRAGVRWLIDHQQVDPQRIGLYGGSYGGFLTLMALFLDPETYACGAALRPVTDWAHYNHGYTSRILNVPTLDEEAYRRSSPIEFAQGLAKPLLICHGMQDSNVFFQDTVRLAQRLIDLGKEDWEVALFPMEGHGFQRPSSWLDEFRRIFKLFETHLKP
ncbi:MAG: S9 family peptidase [Planctomycetota bacterium]|nr:MAG: S9 family peptidase [Planctomycetota bacterium]